MIDPYNAPNGTNAILFNLLALILQFFEHMKITDRQALAQV